MWETKPSWRVIVKTMEAMSFGMAARVEISKRLALINSVSSVVTRVINISVLVWLYQYLLRRIDPDEYSLYPVVMSVMMLVPVLTTVFTSGIGRYVVEAYAKGDTRGVTQIVSTMCPIVLAVSSVLLSLGWLFAWHVDHVLTVAPAYVSDARLMMGLLMSLAAVRLFLTPFTLGLYVRQRFVLSNVLGLGCEAFRIALLFVLLFAVEVRVLWVVVASVTAETLRMMLTVVVSRRLIPELRFRPAEIRWNLARTLMSFGGWSFLLQIADKIRVNADAIVLNKLGTGLDVASFHLGSVLFRHVQVTSYLVRAPLQPQLTALHATGAAHRLRSAYLRGGRYALWASMFLALPLIVYRKEIVTLYVGEKYLASAIVLALLMATFPLAYGNVMFPHIARAKAEIRSWAIRAIIIHVSNLILTLYLVGVRKMGAVGSALGTFTTCLVFEPLFYWPLGLRMAGVDWRTWVRETLWPGFLPGLVAVPVWLVLQRLVEPRSWLGVVSCVLVGSAVFLFCVLRFALQDADRHDLGHLVERVCLRLVPPGRRRRGEAAG
jgi:O-antigen/teichoic acid export membrane protein